MTGPAIGGTERGTRAPTRLTGTLGAVGAVLVVLALGLVLRVILARLLPGSGFGVDLGAFRFWASNLATQGFNGFYDRDFFHDYTPGYLYVLWLVGIIGNAAGGVGDLIKIPPILADLAIGWLAWSMVRELGGRDRLALGAAAVAVLNPISWFDSVVWGQADSFGVVFLLLGLRELWRDRPERAAIYTVIAAIIKPQLGILIPLVAVVTIRRALWPAGGHGNAASTGRPIRILTTGLAGFVTAVVLSLPFGLSVIELTGQPPYLASGLLKQVAVAAGGYPYLTVNAYNPWAVVAGDLGHSLANAGLWVCDYAGTAQDCASGTSMFGPIPAVVIGTTLLLAVIVRRPGGRRAPAGSAHPARRADDPGAGVLRRPDPRPRAVRVSGLRAGGHPRRDRLALAGRLPRPDRDDLPEHVRGADQPVLRQPRDQGLAGHRQPRALRADHRGHRAGQRDRLRVDARPAPAARP